MLIYVCQAIAVLVAAAGLLLVRRLAHRGAISAIVDAFDATTSEGRSALAAQIDRESRDATRRMRRVYRDIAMQARLAASVSDDGDDIETGVPAQPKASEPKTAVPV